MINIHISVFTSLWYFTVAKLADIIIVTSLQYMQYASNRARDH